MAESDVIVKFRADVTEMTAGVDKAKKSVVDLASTTERAQNKIISTNKRTASSFNGLGNSINQLSRELPAFTYSAQTGFMALSNNIPMLADEINKLKAQNIELTKSGKEAIPVWKSVTSALFSWQTLLSVGVTLLTLYGGKLVEFIGTLFETEKTLNKVRDAQKALNDIKREGALNSVKESLNYKLLRDNIEAEYASRERRLDAINKLRQAYPKIFKDYSDEALLAGQASEAYDKLGNAIQAKNRVAEASTKIDALTKDEVALLDRQKEITQESLRILREQISLEAMQQGMRANQVGYDSVVKKLNDTYKKTNDLNKEGASIEQKLINLRSKMAKIQGEASTDLGLSLVLEKELNKEREKEDKTLTEREKILAKIAELEIKIQNSVILKGRYNEKDKEALRDQLNLLHQIDDEYERIMLTIGDVAKIDRLKIAGIEKVDDIEKRLLKEREDLFDANSRRRVAQLEKERQLRIKQEEEYNNILQQSAIQVSNSYLSITGNFVQSHIDSITTAKEANIAQIDELLERGLISQKQYDDKKAKLEREADSRTRDLLIKQFEREKAVKTAQAIMDGVLAVQKAYAELGPIFGLPAAIAIGIVSAANVVAIQTQPLPKFEKGGLIDGKRHKQGGVIIEAEGGEFINNRISTQKYKEELESANNLSLERLIHRKHVIPAIRKEREKIFSTISSSFNDSNLLMSDRETRQILRDIRDGVKQNSGYSKSVRFK